MSSDSEDDDVISLNAQDYNSIMQEELKFN